jgi:hypothetical protein
MAGTTAIDMDSLDFLLKSELMMAIPVKGYSSVY